MGEREAYILQTKVQFLVLLPTELILTGEKMKFRKYSSIENTSRTKTINYITETGNADGKWVSTLKIHGANYSIWTDGKDVKCGKRSGFIEGHAFYGDFNKLKKLGFICDKKNPTVEDFWKVFSREKITINKQECYVFYKSVDNNYETQKESKEAYW